MGSKNRLAKHLLPIMLAERGSKAWVEPFVGGANMIDKVDGERLGNDNHKCLIALLVALQNGWVPPITVSKELYYDVKAKQNAYPNELVGFVGFLCSFGGKWWGGYAKNAKGDNYAERGSRVLVKQAKSLRGVAFSYGDYSAMVIPPKSLLYCDPPYEGTTKYTGHFDHKRFWCWCKDKSREGHIVFVSEYAAPKNFECVKTVKHKTILDKNSQYERTEKLFLCT